MINEMWIAAYAVNECAELGKERVMAIVNRIYDHEPIYKEILEEIGYIKTKVEGETEREISVAVIGWQRMRIGEERKS